MCYNYNLAKMQIQTKTKVLIESKTEFCLALKVAGLNTFLTQLLKIKCSFKGVKPATTTKNTAVTAKSSLPSSGQILTPSSPTLLPLIVAGTLYF